MEKFGQDSTQFNQDYLDSQKRAQTFNEDRKNEQEESRMKKLREDAEKVAKDLAEKKRLEDEEKIRLENKKAKPILDNTEKPSSQEKSPEEIMEVRIASGVDQIERKEMPRGGEKK